MNAITKDFENQIKNFQQKVILLRSNLQRAVIGQDLLISDTIIALLSGGHILLEGLPGLGKTHLVKAISNSLGLSMARVQCTPDLMPSDITGSEILVQDKSALQHKLEFRRGPIFSSLVLVDEINRATPKTQASLLEAMQEHQVTYSGMSYPLPEPFWVIATQNPIELEGTYPLPEAQLDRFMYKLQVQFPSADSLLDMLDVSLDEEPADKIQPVLSLEEVNEMITFTREVIISDTVKQAAINMLMATHNDSPDNNPVARKYFRYGASPRGLQAIIRASRIHALLDGRAHVAVNDIRDAALPSLRHRVLLNMESEMNGIDIDSVLNEIITQWIKIH